jgi:hypothetical protein
LNQTQNNRVITEDKSKQIRVARLQPEYAGIGRSLQFLAPLPPTTIAGMQHLSTQGRDDRLTLAARAKTRAGVVNSRQKSRRPRQKEKKPRQRKKKRTARLVHLGNRPSLHGPMPS